MVIIIYCCYCSISQLEKIRGRKENLSLQFVTSVGRGAKCWENIEELSLKVSGEDTELTTGG